MQVRYLLLATEPAAVAKKGGGFLLLHSRVTKKGRPVYSSTEMLSCLSYHSLYHSIKLLTFKFVIELLQDDAAQTQKLHAILTPHYL